MSWRAAQAPQLRRLFHPKRVGRTVRRPPRRAGAVPDEQQHPGHCQENTRSDPGPALVAVDRGQQHVHSVPDPGRPRPEPQQHQCDDAPDQIGRFGTGVRIAGHGRSCGEAGQPDPCALRQCRQGDHDHVPRRADGIDPLVVALGPAGNSALAEPPLRSPSRPADEDQHEKHEGSEVGSEADGGENCQPDRDHCDSCRPSPHDTSTSGRDGTLDRRRWRGSDRRGGRSSIWHGRRGSGRGRSRRSHRRSRRSHSGRHPVHPSWRRRARGRCRHRRWNDDGRGVASGAGHSDAQLLDTRPSFRLDRQGAVQNRCQVRWHP
jgi:hypothetical protein